MARWKFDGSMSMNWDKRLEGYQGELGVYRRQFILTAIRLCQSPTQMIQDGTPESPLEGWFPKSRIFRFSVRPISRKTCPNCTWPSPTFRKFVRTLGASLCLPKSSIHHGSDPGPPKTHHHGIFTTLPLAHTPILVCLRFGFMSSREDLSRLWNWLFRSQGPIPVQMAPCLTALF